MRKLTGSPPFSEMQHRILLSLTGDQTVLELAAEASGAGVLERVRSLLAHRVRRESGLPTIKRVELATTQSIEALFPRLSAGLSQLQSMHAQPLAGARLEVKLGMDYAHIGLAPLAGVSSVLLTPKHCDAYAHAWVRQMLHLDPVRCVIRWELLEQSKQLLVSCVNREVVQALTEFCQQNGLRFAHCQPAVLSALRGAHVTRDDSGATSDKTMAWIETGRLSARSSKLQLLQFKGKSLAGTWRGWVPASTQPAGEDRALEEAILRFQRGGLAPPGTTVQRMSWPSPPGASARLS